ncbi:Mu-like prophage FluMu protein [Erwinia amylovora Ea644]|uniref:DUF2635 domain-containing protein n=1 Tax=Erwinia amylovora TaxID=552 RepID=UPI0002CB0623|nr:DUF2635 domain-containing protein [Erwinia amylovora]CCP02968.1 Mu-like prophage FluMu protein [Erwinia amylovora Ea644]
MFVKPVPGRIVRDPVKGTPLPASGENVPDSAFWHRRLKDGDVVQAKEEQPAPKASPRAADKTAGGE